MHETWVVKDPQPLAGITSPILTFDVVAAAKRVITFIHIAVPAVVSENRQRGESIPAGSVACEHQMGLRNSSTEKFQQLLF